MVKIDITRTELVWPGKYNQDGTLKEVPRVSLPFQVIETVNESRATREAKKARRCRSSTLTRAMRATLRIPGCLNSLILQPSDTCCLIRLLPSLGGVGCPVVSARASA